MSSNYYSFKDRRVALTEDDLEYTYVCMYVRDTVCTDVYKPI